MICLVIAAALGASGAGEAPRYYVPQLQVVQRVADTGRVIDWDLRCWVWDGNHLTRLIRLGKFDSENSIVTAKP